MDAIKLYSQVNHLDGTFIQVGFGKGTFIKSIFNGMNEGKLTKRNTWIFDSFKGNPKLTPLDRKYNPNLKIGYEPGRIGAAMDMRFMLTNPVKHIEIVRGFIEDTLPSSGNITPIVCVHIDLSSYSSTLHTLNTLHQNIVRDGLIYVSDYKTNVGVTAAVDHFIQKNSLKHQLHELDGFTYIRNKIPPVSFADKNIDKAGIPPEQAPYIERPKPTQPFEDRYVKQQVPVFVPTPVVNENASTLSDTKIVKSDKAPEKGIKVQRPAAVKPFEDRYVKKEIPKFIPQKVVKEGLTLLDQKVTR